MSGQIRVVTNSTAAGVLLLSEVYYPAWHAYVDSQPSQIYASDHALRGIAVPAGKDAQGLPLGLQLIGRPFDEETLFSLGEVVEQAAGRFTPPRWW